MLKNVKKFIRVKGRVIPILKKHSLKDKRIFLSKKTKTKINKYNPAIPNKKRGFLKVHPEKTFEGKRYDFTINDHLVGFAKTETIPRRPKSVEITEIKLGSDFRARGLGKEMYRKVFAQEQLAGKKFIRGDLWGSAAHGIRSRYNTRKRYRAESYLFGYEGYKSKKIDWREANDLIEKIVKKRGYWNETEHHVYATTMLPKPKPRQPMIKATRSPTKSEKSLKPQKKFEIISKKMPFSGGTSTSRKYIARPKGQEYQAGAYKISYRQTRRNKNWAHLDHAGVNREFRGLNLSNDLMDHTLKQLEKSGKKFLRSNEVVNPRQISVRDKHKSRFIVENVVDGEKFLAPAEQVKEILQDSNLKGQFGVKASTMVGTKKAKNAPIEWKEYNERLKKAVRETHKRRQRNKQR